MFKLLTSVLNLLSTKLDSISSNGQQFCCEAVTTSDSQQVRRWIKKVSKDKTRRGRTLKSVDIILLKFSMLLLFF